MGDELLLDTGALVSLLDQSQRKHPECAAFFSGWEGPVVSTEAVLTEAAHLLGRVPEGPRRCLDFFVEGGATLVPSSLQTLRRCRELMTRYSNLPMDYADASLVALAEELGTRWVFTIDRRDFTIYRIGGRRAFKIVPEDE